MTALPNYSRALVVIVVVSTAIRLAASFGVPILDDEAHYWVWSKHLMWGFPDHPPMIAALVALSTRLLGDSVPALRIMPVLLGTLSTVLIFLLARRLFSPAAGIRAAVLLQVLPAFAASGIMTAPDGPMGTFWLLAMLLAWMAVEGERWAWPAAGVAAGVVVQCKLAGGAIAISLIGFVLTSRSQRRWLRTPGPYLAALAGALVLSPLVWWNMHYNWATVRRAFVVVPWVHPVGPLGNIAIFVASQFVYFAPLGFCVLVAGLVGILKRYQTDERFRFLLWAAAPTLIAVLLASVRAFAKPHYTGPALLSAIVAAAGLWETWSARRLLRAAVASSAVLTLAVLVLASVPNPLAEDFQRDTRGWQEVGRQVETILPSLGPPGQVFVLARTYQAGSQIAFAIENSVPVVVPFRGFVIWEPPAKWIHHNGLLVDHLGGIRLQYFTNTFERVGTPYSVPIRQGYQVLLYPGTDFRGFR